MKTALVMIATGKAYWDYAEIMIVTAKKFFVPHDVLLFTDCPKRMDVVKQVSIDDLPFDMKTWPMPTLLRYHAMMTQKVFLEQYDQMFYSDADMRFVAPVDGTEVWSEGITATEHPGFVGEPGTPETRKFSTAYAPQQLRMYFCGGFNGGAVPAFLRMAEDIRQAIDVDLQNGVIAVWHDESHLNRYLYDHEPAKVLSPAFCYPDREWRINLYRTAWTKTKGPDYFKTIKPKLLAIEKGGPPK